MKSETNGLILKIAPLLPYASALSTCLSRNVSRSTNRNTGRRKRMLSTVGNGAWLRKRRLDPCFYSGERDGGIILYFLSSTLAVLPALPVCQLICTARRPSPLWDKVTFGLEAKDLQRSDFLGPGRHYSQEMFRA